MPGRFPNGPRQECLRNLPSNNGFVARAMVREPWADLAIEALMQNEFAVGGIGNRVRQQHAPNRSLGAHVWAILAWGSLGREDVQSLLDAFCQNPPQLRNSARLCKSDAER